MAEDSATKPPAPGAPSGEKPAASTETTATPEAAVVSKPPVTAQQPVTPAAPVAAKPPAPAAPTSEKPAAPPAAPAAVKPAPVVHVYNRQKDQHVVGPGCWCFPKIEIVDGRRIVVHKRS